MFEYAKRNKPCKFFGPFKGVNMNSQSNPPSSSRPVPIRDDREAPNLDPIRDDPEPMLEPALGPPRKKLGQIVVDSDEAKEKVAKEISNTLRQENVAADMQTNTKATPPEMAQETARLKKVREDEVAHGHDLRDF